MALRNRLVAISCATLGLGGVLVPAVADPGVIPDPGVAVLHAETPRGTGAVVPAPPRAPSPKRVDGNAGDWIGTGSGFGGTIVRSAGELVYQDHLFDAYGADAGDDADRAEVLGPPRSVVPETYRIEAIIKQDLASTVGLPETGVLAASEQYGDLDRADSADILEARVAADGGDALLLVRTTTMLDPAATAVVVLVDTGGGPADREVPFGTGLRSAAADVAILLNGSTGRVTDLATGTTTDLPPGAVATDPGGWNNAIEARLPRAMLGATPRIAIAAGTPTATGDVTVANVAFRTAEPVRTWFDQHQAAALRAGSIDQFFVGVDLDSLANGVTERWVPEPGYHDRVFRSSERISRERGMDGIHQHYGVYLPVEANGTARLPVQWWFHWRGGHAHTAGGVIPGMFDDLGADRGAIVVAPRGRGTSTWYVGAAHVDFQEVWADVFATFPVDANRVYISGHSMGGWATYLMTVLYPDRFAAGAPVAGPVTQGAWTGADFDGCDEFAFEDYSPCYIEANGSRPRDQHTRRLLENLRHVPLTILQGAIDELVPVSGVTRQVEQLVQLGYRHEYNLFPTYEHYTHPVVDEWALAGWYFDRHVRDPNPARVTYRRDMRFERAVEEVQAEGLGLDFAFDSAYWMSGLTPVDPMAGMARFDGRSLAITGAPQLTVPDVSGPGGLGQTGPYVKTGLFWIDDPLGTSPARANEFEATLEGASAVTLDAARMRLATDRVIVGRVSADAPLRLTIRGRWAAAPLVDVDGAPAVVGATDGGVVISVPPGSHVVSIG